MEKLRVFIVDDSPDVVSLISSVVSMQSNMYVIDTASNGEEAFQKIRALGKIDILFTDLIMPRLDGFNLLKRLKEKNTKENTGTDHPFRYHYFYMQSDKRLLGVSRCFIKTNPVKIQSFRNTHCCTNWETIITQFNTGIIAAGDMSFLSSNFLRQTLTFSQFD